MAAVVSFLHFPLLPNCARENRGERVPVENYSAAAAAGCAIGSSRSRVSSVIFLPLPPTEERCATFAALPRFVFDASPPRALDALPPALERRFIVPRRLRGNRSRSKAYPGSGLFVCV